MWSCPQGWWDWRKRLTSWQLHFVIDSFTSRFSFLLALVALYLTVSSTCFHFSLEIDWISTWPIIASYEHHRSNFVSLQPTFYLSYLFVDSVSSNRFSALHFDFYFDSAILDLHSAACFSVMIVFSYPHWSSHQGTYQWYLSPLLLFSFSVSSLRNEFKWISKVIIEIYKI